VVGGQPHHVAAVAAERTEERPVSAELAGLEAVAEILRDHGGLETGKKAATSNAGRAFRAQPEEPRPAEASNVKGAAARPAGRDKPDTSATPSHAAQPNHRPSAKAAETSSDAFAAPPGQLPSVELDRWEAVEKILRDGGEYLPRKNAAASDGRRESAAQHDAPRSAEASNVQAEAATPAQRDKPEPFMAAVAGLQYDAIFRWSRSG
jgi:hypothetical protein